MPICERYSLKYSKVEEPPETEDSVIRSVTQMLGIVGLHSARKKR